MIHRFSFPTSIALGVGARHEVDGWLKENNLSNPLIVTDKGLLSVELARDFIGSRPVFSDITTNPRASTVAEGARAIRAQKADSIIGLGGGSALDVAKALALMARNPGEILDYTDRPIDGQILPWIAIPTTSGTGSEVGRSTVISDDVTHVKKIIFSPKLMARAVFADPELTVALPPALTAATGIDALTHCIEAYLAKDYHPLCDGIAFEGVLVISDALPRAFSNGSDLKARTEMMMGSIMGGVAFQKGLGVVHSCAHALSALYNLHHGLTNALMLRPCLRFNAPSCPDRIENLGLSDFDDFFEQLRLPQTLADAGVSSPDIEKLSDLAFADSCHENNPRPVTRDDIRNLFEEVR